MGGLREWLSGFHDMPFAMVYMTGMFRGMSSVVAPLWYMSAMFIVFPLFCYILTWKSEKLRLIVALYVPLIYFGGFGLIRTAEYPHNLLRAVSGLLLGTFMFYLSKYIAIHREYCYPIGKAIPIIGIVLSVISVILLVTSWIRLALFCFIIGFSIHFSNSTNIRSGVADYLGALSGYVFIIHWVMGCLVKLCFRNYPVYVSVSMFFITSFIVSAIAMMLTRRLLGRRTDERT